MSLNKVNLIMPLSGLLVLTLCQAGFGADNGYNVNSRPQKEPGAYSSVTESAETSAGIDKDKPPANDADKSSIDNGEQTNNRPSTENGADQKKLIQELSPLLKMETAQLDKSTPQNKVLTGSVDHANKLTVPKMLQAGATYSSKDAEAISMNDIWFRIPNWLAGRWNAAGTLLVYHANFKNGHCMYPNKALHRPGDDSGISTYGWQQDKEGNYWQYEKLGSSAVKTRTNEDGNSVHRINLSYVPVVSTKTQLSMKRVFTSTVLQPGTNIVLRTGTYEVIEQYFILGPGKIAVIESSKLFDTSGNSLGVSEYHRFKTRNTSYTAVNEFEGKDMKESLRQYLGSHGLERLAP